MNWKLSAIGCAVFLLPACSGSTVAPVPVQPAARVVATVAPKVVTETPLLSDSLADSVGLNANITTNQNDADWQTLLSRLKTLAIRHIRDGILVADPTYDSTILQILGASSAKFDGITDCAGTAPYPGAVTSPTAIQNFNTAIGGNMEYFEGPNEPDARNIANWVNDVTTCLPALHYALPGIPFEAPALADPYHNAPKLGSVAANVDLGNLHRYFSGRNPGTLGWGGRNPCGIYGSLPWAICEGQINSGPASSVMITETGYNTNNEVDTTTQGKYISRLFFLNLQAGVKHSYIYCLRDYTGGDSSGGDGLLTTSDTPKPAFNAVANEIAYFSDMGAPFTTTSLTYSISTSAIDHLLLQKRNGTYVLALWNETASWNPTTHTPIAVAPVPVTVALPSAPVQITATSLNDAGALVPTTVTLAGVNATVPVDDHMTFVSFTTTTNAQTVIKKKGS